MWHNSKNRYQRGKKARNPIDKNKIQLTRERERASERDREKARNSNEGGD